MTLTEAIDILKARGVHAFRAGRGSEWRDERSWPDDEALIEEALRLDRTSARPCDGIQGLDGDKVGVPDLSTD